MRASDVFDVRSDPWSRRMPRRRSRRGRGTVTLSAATAGPRCAPIIMDYVRRRPRAGNKNSAVRSRAPPAAAPARPAVTIGIRDLSITLNRSSPCPIRYTYGETSMEMVRLSGRPHGQWVGPAGFGWPRRGAKPKMGQAATHSSTHSRTFKGGQESEKFWAPRPAQGPAPQFHRCQNVFEDRAQRLTLRCRMRSLTSTVRGAVPISGFPKMDRFWIGCRFACGFVSFFSR